MAVVEEPAFEHGDGTESGAAPLLKIRPKGRYSVVRIPDHWFILCTSKELSEKPLTRMLMSTPLVLFRDAQGRASALLDRCPHRNVPLSLGGVASDGTLECGYHGWRFNGAGECIHIPSRAETDQKARRCATFATIEQQGFVWVYSTPDVEPKRSPYRFELEGAKGYITVRQAIDMEGTLYSTIENALDVPHTAFLHRGLFRAESRGIKIKAKVKRTKDRVEVDYIGEPRPTGVMAKVLSPSGGVVTHCDRFILPSIAQVEYRIGSENHLLADTAMTPISDFTTRLWGVVSLSTRIPARAIEPFVKPIAMRVLGQDALMLKRQTETIRAFGGEQFVSTEIDVIGRHVWKLLRAAERGDEYPLGEETEVELVV